MPARHAIEDDQWDRIKHLLPGCPGQPVLVSEDNRRFTDSVPWTSKNPRRHAMRTAWVRTMPLMELIEWEHEDDKKRSSDAYFDHQLIKPVDLTALGKLLASIYAAMA